MNEHESKPHVAPPAGYKPPSLPTLAALGALGTAALMSGCDNQAVMGKMVCPTDRIKSTEEPNQPPATIDEKTPEEILEGVILIKGDMG